MWAFGMKIIYYSHTNKTHLHAEGFAPSLVLKVRAPVYGNPKIFTSMNHGIYGMRNHRSLPRLAPGEARPSTRVSSIASRHRVSLPFKDDGGNGWKR